MWKIGIAFAIFAALALFALMKAGDKVDMGGEKHDTGSHSAPAASTPATVPAANASAPVPAPVKP